MTRVLVVDDEPQIARALRVALSARGYDVDTAGNGETALERHASNPADVIVLDLGLPGIDGVEVTRRLRGWSQVPIIVLSVRDAQDDKVAALDAGADDYLTKPFGMDELLARIRAALRRIPEASPGPATLTFGSIDIDLAKRLVRKDGEALHLTPTEYDLLEALVRNPGKLLTHRWLLSKVWGGAYGGESHYVRVYVAQLRRKLEDEPSRPRWILTEPGLGYRWAEESVT
ncbi:MAG: response regulator transcription factor [Actinomycetota bacterium]